MFRISGKSIAHKLFRADLRLALVAILWSFGLLLLTPKPAPAQTPQLDSLLILAEASWPQLAERRAAIQVARASATESQRAYLPSISVGGTYTLAAGGRTIDLPLGDLLNGPYAALNQLTQTNQFPQLENAEEPLLPNNFYDARVRVQQPILQPQIANSRLRAQAGIDAAEASADVVAADLRLAVRQAYFQTLSARTAVAAYAAAVELIDESYRTTSSLVRNGAALPLARERIVAERARLQAQLAAAEAQQANAEANLTYLVGQPGSSVVPTVTFVANSAGQTAAAVDSSIRWSNLADAPELQQLTAALRVATLESSFETMFRRPRVGLQLDAGSQDFNFGLQPYVLAGLSVEVPLYDGGRHGARTQRLAAQRQVVEQQLVGTRRALELREQVARNDLIAAQTMLEAYAPALKAAQSAERDATLLYQNGSTGYVELLDAQNQLTRTRLERSAAEYAVWLKYAAFLRAINL